MVWLPIAPVWAKKKLHSRSVRRFCKEIVSGSVSDTWQPGMTVKRKGLRPKQACCRQQVFNGLQAALKGKIGNVHAWTEKAAATEICTPSKGGKPRKRRSIITAALAFTVSLYECRHILIIKSQPKRLIKKETNY